MGSFFVRVGLPVILLAVLASPFQFVSSDHGGGGGDSALASTPKEAARALYNNTRIDDVRRIYPQTFTNAFSSLHLYEVNEPVRHPEIMHRMAWNPTTDTGYDVTKEFHSLLTITTAVIATSGDAVKYAKAFAESANVEIEPLRQIVYAANSTMLNRTVADPSASLNGTAWKVTLSTWAEAQGVFANWTIQFAVNQIQFGKWRVQGTGVGPWYFDLHGENSYVGVLVHNAWSAGTYARGLYNDSGTPRTPLQDWYHLNQTALNGTAANHTNYDDSWWKVYYPTSYPWQTGDPVLMDGDALALGGVDAYKNETRRNNNSGAVGCRHKLNPFLNNYRFESGDSDCQLQIILHRKNDHLVPYQSTKAATAEFRNDVIIQAEGFYKAHLQATQRYLDPTIHTNISIARVLMSHEHYHVLQYTISSDFHPNWNMWKEGQAVVVTAVANLPTENHSSSLTVDYLNLYQRHGDPDTAPDGVDDGLCLARPGYTAGLFWAVLYAKNGGMGAFNRTIRDLRAKALSTDLPNLHDNSAEACNAWFMEAITTSLTYLKTKGGLHSNFNDTFRDMALTSYSRNLSFGPPNSTAQHWSHLLEPVRNKSQAIGTTSNYLVQPLGVAFIRPNTNGAFNVTVSGISNGNWKPLMMQKCGDGSVTSTNVTAGLRTRFVSRACQGSENMLAILHPYQFAETATVALET